MKCSTVGGRVSVGPEGFGASVAASCPACGVSGAGVRASAGAGMHTSAAIDQARRLDTARPSPAPGTPALPSERVMPAPARAGNTNAPASEPIPRGSLGHRDQEHPATERRTRGLERSTGPGVERGLEPEPDALEEPDELGDGVHPDRGGLLARAARSRPE